MKNTGLVFSEDIIPSAVSLAPCAATYRLYIDTGVGQDYYKC